MSFILNLILIVLFFPIFLVGFFVVWVSGVPISVRISGTKVGYLRWFKYTKV